MSRVERGLRVRQLREDELGITGDALVDVLNAAASRLGFAPIYDRAKLSKIETGVRDLSLEDVAVIEQIDPKGRSWHWIAFGMTDVPKPQVGAGAPKREAREPQRGFIPTAKRGRGGR